MRLRLLLVVVVVLVAAAGRAHADSRTAEILIKECQKHFNALEYELAAMKCEAALKSDQTMVGALRWLTIINRALGKKTNEVRHYQQCIAWAEMYLRERPTGKFTDRMKDEINACRRAMGQKELPKVDTQGQTGALVIACDVDGATVTVDDLRRGGTPLNPIQVTPGRHTLTVYKFGYLPYTAVVDVVTKQVHEIKVSLQRDPNAPVVDTPASRPIVGTGLPGLGPVGVFTGGGPVVDEGTVRIEIEPEHARLLVDGKPRGERAFTVIAGTYVMRVEADGYEPWERRVVVTRGQARQLNVQLRAVADRQRDRKWAWALTGVATVTAGVGAYFGLAEAASYKQAEDLFQQARRGAVAADTRTRIAAYRNDGDRQQVIAAMSLGVSLVALAGAVYFWIRERGGEHPAGEAPALAVHPTPLPGGGGLILAREFGR
jgi:hypothetical protein